MVAQAAGEPAQTASSKPLHIRCADVGAADRQWELHDCPGRHGVSAAPRFRLWRWASTQGLPWSTQSWSGEMQV
jgi:hypothetical protein